MEQPRVSIVLRSFNEGWALPATLEAIRTQTYDNWELIAFDSGSTDGSVELLRAAGPAHLVQMLPHEYKPGRVLNQGMALAKGDRVIFLNADATPQGPDWLGPLVEALSDTSVAAVYGRQVPRPDCDPVFARDYERCYGTEPKPGTGGHFFSMVSSGLRREAWLKERFNENMQYSEDDEYTRRCRTRGYRVAYCPSSVVMHSHNYTPRQAYKRSFGESWARAAASSGPLGRVSLGRTLVLGWVREVLGDIAYGLRKARLRGMATGLRIRWQQRLGRVHGFHAGWQMHRVDKVV
jgi:rhamnosyltransferase